MGPMSSTAPSSPIRVGIVGANPTRGWAYLAHLPALAELPDFELVAVATTKKESAEATAKAWGIELSFDRGTELATHPDVDLVVVSVKVPDHAEVVRAAVGAGKHVFCEWPLGVDLAEATELAELADRAGVKHLIGLQGKHSSGARYVHDLIAEGRIGQVQSASVIASSGLGGVRVPSFLSWAVAREAGVSALTITGGHVLGTLTEVLGDLSGLSATVGNLVREATVVDTGETVPVTAPGQLVVQGSFANGAVVSVSIQGAAPPGAGGFYLRIIGTEGAITVTPTDPNGSIHITDWHIELAGPSGPAEVQTIPEEYRVVPDAVPADQPQNVGALYQELARAVAEDREAYPSFATAVAFHRLLDTIDASSASGTHQPVD
jgi:predicted dehydrogenase